MPSPKHHIRRILNRLFPPHQSHSAPRDGRSALARGLSKTPKSLRVSASDDGWFASGGYGREFSVRLHRFLRDHVPILKSVVWTWTRLAAAPHHFEFDTEDEQLRAQAQSVIDSLDRQIHPERIARHGGFDALLVQYFDTLFTDGAVAGELSILPSHRGLDRFDFIDTASLDFDADPVGRWQLYQRRPDTPPGGEDRILLNSDAIYYQPLDADAGRPSGKSLLAAVAFVARIEQELVRDMRLSMRNAGYHRLHVRVKPPAQAAGESDGDYTSRANSYFDATARALRDLEVDDNPVTWDDVEITHIGPGAQVTASRNWYLNHRAMVEDVIAGCHLAPFMLGYSYGTTQTWARFKYEMVGRQITTLQRAASRFCEWIAGIELALAGIDIKVRHAFDNRLEFDRAARLEADRLETDIRLRQLDAGLINADEARRLLSR